MNKLLLTALVLFAVALVGCENELVLNVPGSGIEDPGNPVDNPEDDKLPGEGEGEGEVEQPPPPPPPPPPPTLQESTKGLLVWKRYRALEQDLMRGLSLSKAQVCSELGQYSCVDEVHLAALGGNEPFDKSQYEPSREPTATSSIAIDRVVLSACSERARADRAGTAQVFTDLDLTSTATTEAEADATTTTLFRKLLARDPTTVELEKMRELTVDAEGLPIGGETFATLACFTVGTHVEFLFF